MSNTYYYNVAELPFTLTFVESSVNGLFLLPSLKPFECQEHKDKLFFHLTVDDAVRPVKKEHRTRIKDVDTGNGHTIVDLLDDGGYQFVVKDIFGTSCCLLITDKDFQNCRCALNGDFGNRTFGLNNALMLIFAFAGSRKDVILLHASLVRKDGYGYAFIAKSGTGKSTQVSMWLRYIPGCDLMNDDNPIVRMIDGEPFIYGSPWSGKTPCYRNVKARLGAITRIVRDKDNFVEQVSPIEAFTNLLTSCSTMKWDEDIFNRICSIIGKIIETTPNYNFHCRPDKESAIVCHKGISRSEN